MLAAVELGYISVLLPSDLFLSPANLIIVFTYS